MDLISLIYTNQMLELLILLSLGIIAIAGSSVLAWKKLSLKPLFRPSPRTGKLGAFLFVIFFGSLPLQVLLTPLLLEKIERLPADSPYFVTLDICGADWAYGKGRPSSWHIEETKQKLYAAQLFPCDNKDHWAWNDFVYDFLSEEQFKSPPTTIRLFEYKTKFLGTYQFYKTPEGITASMITRIRYGFLGHDGIWGYLGAMLTTFITVGCFLGLLIFLKYGFGLFTPKRTIDYTRIRPPQL